MNTMKNNSVAYFTTYLTEQLEREREHIRVHKAIRTVLEKWNNKRITRRIVEQVQKAAYPDDDRVTIYYDECASLLNLRIWGGKSGTTYEHRNSYFLGYTGAPFAGTQPDKYVYAGSFKAESFEDSDASNGHAAEARCTARQALLDKPEMLRTLVQSIAKVRAAYEAFKELVEGGESQLANPYREVCYEAERVLALEQSRNR